MVSESDLRELKSHINPESASSSGQLALGIEVATEEQLIADGDYSDYTYKRVDIPTDGHTYLAESMYNVLEDFIKSVENNTEISKYDIRSVNKDHTPIQYMSRDDIPNFHRFHEVTSDSKIGEKSTYSESRPEFQAYIFSLDPVITGFRVYTHRQVIESDEFRMYETDNEYSQFNKDLYTLPKNFDAIYYNGNIIVNNPNNFETIFDYFEVYKAHADGVLSTLQSSDINIRDFGEFTKAILDDRRALRKMKAIEDVGLYREIGREDVERVIEEFDLTVTVDESEGEWELVIPDYRYKWDVIRLLNDDHLYSELTEGRYQVYGKDKR